jgi:hypothetical protein
MRSSQVVVLEELNQKKTENPLQRGYSEEDNLHRKEEKGNIG